MDWTDDAIVLELKPHGEHGVVLEVFTRNHGRHLGLVHGGLSPRRRAAVQPGNSVRLHWRARLSEHLGAFSVELVAARAAEMFEDRAALAGLNAFTAITSTVLPERERHTSAFEGAVALLDAMARHSFSDWAPLFVRWELGLLAELGFGLDLTRCAVTGAAEDLAYVSPRTGRAVSSQAGFAYKEKLLALPAFLTDRQTGIPTRSEIGAGFALTAHFLEQWVLAPHGRTLPEARARLAEREAPEAIESA
jgi:DNA repair protein RecO (recombination protein O)